MECFGAKKFPIILLLVFVLLLPHLLYLHTLTNREIIGYPGGDTLSQGAIFTHFAWQSVKEDRVPAWYNPYIYNGMPFVESKSYSYSYPFNWTFLVLPFVFAFNYQFTFHLVILGAITAFVVGWYYKKYSLGFAAALFIFINAHIISLTYPGHGGKFFALLYFLPLLYLFRSLLEKYRFPAALLFIVLTVLQVKTGHLQIVFYTGGFLFLYALYFFFTRYSSRSRKDWGKVFLLLFFLSILIFLGTVHKIIPALHYKQFTVRAEPLAQEEAFSGSLPVQEISEMFWLNAFGYSHSRDYQGSMKERLVSDFVLPFLTILSLSFFLYGSRDRWFYLFLVFITVFMGTGGYNPLLRFIYRFIPFIRYFRAPMAILCLTHFCLLITALESLSGKYYLKTQAKDLFISGIILLSTLLLTRSGYFLSLPFWTTLFLYGVSYLALFSPPETKKTLLALALGLNVAVGFIHVRNFIPTEPASHFFNHLQSPPLVRFMRPDTEGRLLFVRNEKTNRFMYQKATSLFGYHPLAPVPYLEFTDRYPPLENPEKYNLRLVFSFEPLDINGFEEISAPGVPYAYQNRSPPAYIRNQTTEEPVEYSFIRRNANSFQLQFTLDRESRLIILENLFPGWRVKNDGKKILPEEANHPFFQFHLPAGKHDLNFEYSPPYLKYYWFTFIIFLFGLFLLKYQQIDYFPATQ